jgi:succinyl-CoA:(S)-malate CoA-transferase subunit B
MVADWTRRFARKDLMEMCEQAQVPSGPVYSIDEIFEDPQYLARKNILSVDDPRLGPVHVPNVVPRLTETPGEIRHLGASLGEHNRAVYQGLLGVSDGEMTRLEAAGVI